MASNDTERVTAATCPSSFLPTGYPYIPERDFSSAIILHHLRCTAVLQTWAWGLQDAGAHKEAIRAALSESASMSHVMAITREALQAGELARRAEVEDAKERELQLLRGLLSSTCDPQQIEDIYRYCAYPQGAFDPAPVVKASCTWCREDLRVPAAPTAIATPTTPRPSVVPSVRPNLDSVTPGVGAPNTPRVSVSALVGSIDRCRKDFERAPRRPMVTPGTINLSPVPGSSSKRARDSLSSASPSPRTRYQQIARDAESIVVNDDAPAGPAISAPAEPPALSLLPLSVVPW
ncbi:hypothetical protein A7D00_5635 [Trichophyton violaceum]|uniref:Uncharacterized protein n=1 Tax=Trichophyton violaceum TaxID=34388 RepID=A0A178FDU1_TRIVO|nr:hypothetical protein A7D00_5635 [Trichophyton violaceum]